MKRIPLLFLSLGGAGCAPAVVAPASQAQVAPVPASSSMNVGKAILIAAGTISGLIIIGLVLVGATLND